MFLISFGLRYEAPYTDLMYRFDDYFVRASDSRFAKPALCWDSLEQCGLTHLTEEATSWSGISEAAALGLPADADGLHFFGLRLFMISYLGAYRTVRSLSSD